MKTIRPILLLMLLFTLAMSGCYTKFYRPGMERQNWAADKLYNRNDSTAIDTTLMPDTTSSSSYYPNNDDRWYNWGHPRPYRTRWGFDFDSFSPGYYWTYQGYYDYYGTPWWSNTYYDPWWNPYNNNGNGGPVEPPSRREGDRGRIGDGGGSLAPSGGGGGSYAQPAPPPANDQNKDQSTQKNQDTQKSDPNKRNGGRGR
jgi:hypothetical protein